MVPSGMTKWISVIHSASKLKIVGTSRNLVAPHIRSEYVSSIPGVFLWHVLQVEEEHFWDRAWKKGIRDIHRESDTD